MKAVLIKLLERVDLDELCDFFSGDLNQSITQNSVRYACDEVTSCGKCPANNKESLRKLIEELKQ